MSTPAQFRKKPVVIEAMQLTDGVACEEAIKWVQGYGYFASMSTLDPHVLKLATLEGDMFADAFDWIICGVKGEFYPCKPEIFDATYESVRAAAPAPKEER